MQGQNGGHSLAKSLVIDFVQWERKLLPFTMQGCE